jgi:chromosome segregation ATPase
MTTATTELNNPNMEELDKNEQVQESTDQHTDEPTVTNERARQEGDQGDVAAGEGLQEYREQLRQRLDEELTNLKATQNEVAERLQTETESGSIEDSSFDPLNVAASASQERADILAIVRSLERQTDTSTKLKDILEGDVESLQKKLSSEMAARAQLEEKLRSLDTSAGASGNLREENASLRKERDRLASLLEEIKPQLESVTEGRDSLSEEVAFSQKRARELANRNNDLEIQIKHLQEKVTDTEHLRAEATKAKEENQVLTEKVRGLMSRLEEANKIRDTLEADLATSHKAVCNMRKELEDLQGEGADDGSLVSNLRNQLIAQSTELAVANEKIQQETVARREAEEMLREIKSRLLTLSNNKSVASALGSSRG